MSATVCPAGMFLRRVTYQMAYPASTNGSNHRRDIRDVIPLGMALPGPPGMKRSAFGPPPQVRKSIPFANVPLRGPGRLAMRPTSSRAHYMPTLCILFHDERRCHHEIGARCVPRGCYFHCIHPDLGTRLQYAHAHRLLKTGRRARVWRGSVQAPGVSLSFRLPAVCRVALLWPALAGCRLSGERLERGLHSSK